MFWRRIEEDLAERLRVAIEFATLGAYELLPREPQEVPQAAEPAARAEAEPVARPSAPRCVTPPEIRAHVGSSNVPCARADGTLAQPECPQLDRAESLRPKRPARPDPRNRRGGTIRPSQQPCTWAGRQ